MSKPSWSDAPEWANYLAMDEDGAWYWFENHPRMDHECSSEYGTWYDFTGKYERTSIYGNWKESLEARPE